MKVLLLRADNLRHQALGLLLESAGILSGEVIESKESKVQGFTSDLMVKHFLARERSEEDFFGYARESSMDTQRLLITPQELNSNQVINFIGSIDFDIAITFGVSLLKSSLIQHLHNQILGVHLGLSPYYRGSGTNFFPFVESELAAVGYTLMHLNETVDGGPIVHQGRAPIVLGDSIHSIGNRNIKQMFEDIILLLSQNIDLNTSSEIRLESGKMYRRNNFTEEVLRTAYRNLGLGLVESHLNNEEVNLEKFPIVQYPRIRKLQK
jgi:phosphoribosylglycinamide formyltransferase 1